MKTIHPDAFSQLLALQMLNISCNHLEIIPRFPRNLRIIDLRYNNIIYLDSDTFRGMSILLGLSLMVNRLTVLPEDAFVTNFNLQILDLASNNISSVKHHIFPSVSKLERLTLFNNSISVIGSFTNKQFPNLIVLQLSNNSLATLPPGNIEASFPDSIQALNLSWNRIQFIPYDVLKLPNIRDIDLRMNRIATLSRETLKVARQNTMPVNYYLSGNPFSCDCNLAWLKEAPHIQTSVFDDSYIIRDLSSLYCEKVHRHEPGLMKDFPTSWFLCTYTVRCLDSCECCGDEECICRSTCPKNCKCYQNYKQKVDIVDCMGKKLQSIPQDISANCTILDLSGNNFSTIIAGTFKALSHLKELYLNYSHIHEIKEGTFTGLSNLSVLNLGYNFLHNLNTAMFKDLHRLKYLTISFNKIRRIEERSFDTLTNLQYLDLSDNEIKTMSKNEFTRLSKVGSLKLAGNHWSCDCQY
ncbi:MAG: leucine-rich repeat domain-containing protein, partial [Candidatus Thiodiazotropha sp.]